MYDLRKKGHDCRSGFNREKVTTGVLPTENVCRSDFSREEITIKLLPTLLVFLLLLASIPSIAHSAAVGEIKLTSGLVTLVDQGKLSRILGRGDQVHVGDAIHTGIDSSAEILFLDGTRIHLIDNTVFEIKTFSMTQNKAVFYLTQGGLRGQTGSINKSNSDAMKIVTPTADLDIRGTDFTALVCEKNCGKGVQSVNTRKVMKVKTAVKARTVIVRGTVKARSKDGVMRLLQKESPLYVGDTVLTAKKAMAVIVFKDDTRTTVQQDSEFLLENYAYNTEDAEQSEGGFKLVKGSLRFLSGKIGKENRSKYKIFTRTSTIGIRGTGFDLAHKPVKDELPDCEDYKNGKRMELDEADPTYLDLWDGSVEFDYPSGEIIVENGQTYLLPNSCVTPRRIQEMPQEFQGGPRPDSPEVEEEADLPYLFGSRDADGEPGVYLHVTDGEVDANSDNAHLNMGAGETAYIGEDNAYRITEIPDILTETFEQTGQQPGQGGGIICEI